MAEQGENSALSRGLRFTRRDLPVQEARSAALLSYTMIGMRSHVANSDRTDPGNAGKKKRFGSKQRND